MAVQPPLYQLFPLRPSECQAGMDALVTVFWCRLYPGQYFIPNRRLDKIFARMSYRPEDAYVQLCPYYFDQVTYILPTRDQVKHMESCNLRLHCFDSWADFKKEKQRATEQNGRRPLRTNQEVRPSTGIHLGRLCQLQDPNTGRSISTKQYLQLMYG